MDIVRNRHSVGESNNHFQITPKYRRPVFRIRIIRKVTEALIRRKAYDLGVKIEAIEFGPDHVHIFISGCRNYSPSKLIGLIKGYSSYHIRRLIPREIMHFLWGDSFWSDGYFYESIGRVTTESVKFYIARQQGKHWALAELDIPIQKIDTGQRTLDSLYA